MPENEELNLETPTEESLIEELLSSDALESEKEEEEKAETTEDKTLKLKKEIDVPDDKVTRQSSELNEIDKKINHRVDARVNRLEKQLEKKLVAEREAYIGAIATVQEKYDAAIEANNIKEYKRAEDALKTLNTKKDEIETDLKVIKEEPKIEEKIEVAEVKIDAAAERWLLANKKLVEKIDSDAGLSAIAKGISQKLLRNGFAGKPQIELLAEVKKRMLEEMPEDFAGIVSKDEVPNVSGGKMDISSTTGGGKKTYTMKDVPPIDRQILKNYVTAKVYKDETEAVTKYFQRKAKENKQ